MTTQPAPTPNVEDAAADALPRSWQRLLALSGVVFAALFLVGWFTTGGLTPHYTEPNHDWVDWARDNQWNGRISGFLMLLEASSSYTSWERFGACSGVRSPRTEDLHNSHASRSGVP